MQTDQHKLNYRRYTGKLPWRCEVCNRSMGLSSKKAHEKGKGHQRTLAQLSTKQPSSSAQAPSRDNVTSPHLTSDHQSLQNRTPDTGGITNQRKPVKFTRCTLCDRNVDFRLWDGHLFDPIHIQKARLAAYSQGIAEGSDDKYGISIIQAELDFGVIDLSTLADWPIRDDAFYLQVDANAREILLTDIQLSSRLETSAKLRDVNFYTGFSGSLSLTKGLTYAVKVSFNSKGIRGYYEDRVEFTFQIRFRTGITQFVISRPVKALVTIEAHQRQLAPVAPYTRPQRRPRGQKGSITITDGTEQQKTNWIYRLPQFSIPPSLELLLGNGTLTSKVERMRREVVPMDWTHETYTDFWQAMLWAEEHPAKRDMENYDQTDVQFTGRFGRNYLSVPGYYG
ncbi:hypothetical protein M407DRAFT_22507 [Tulasnella calospora MUT 4182]|uniref:U1-type domain-containing protein n=1 Tax=Tulasnella calospora MUT 4182 TaxID=1051891 RepID=A0A0C3QCA0_9AGAM|nr:hypothetical protein M407DRAFT_22507 [Tulasnella calospora MUT 4182]